MSDNDGWTDEERFMIYLNKAIDSLRESPKVIENQVYLSALLNLEDCKTMVKAYEDGELDSIIGTVMDEDDGLLKRLAEAEQREKEGRPYPIVQHCPACGASDVRDVTIIEHHTDDGGPFEVHILGNECIEDGYVFEVIFHINKEVRYDE